MQVFLIIQKQNSMEVMSMNEVKVESKSRARFFLKAALSMLITLTIQGVLMKSGFISYGSKLIDLLSYIFIFFVVFTIIDFRHLYRLITR